MHKFLNEENGHNNSHLEEEGFKIIEEFDEKGDLQFEEVTVKNKMFYSDSIMQTNNNEGSDHE